MTDFSDMSSVKKQSIAFFDVDHTLIDGNSGYYTSLRLIRHGILKKRRVIQAVYYSLASLFFKQDVKKIYEIAIKDMSGSTLQCVLNIGYECFNKDVSRLFYPQAMDLVSKHHQQGDIVVLLTSGPYMLINFVQDYLKAHEAYSMGPEIVEGILTNRLQLPICHAEGKIYYAEMVSKKYNIPLKKCYFYTDHYSDIPLLELVGHPHLVNPDRVLARHNQDKNWPVLKFTRK